MSWARDTQEEMLVTIPRPFNGNNRQSVWLSIDAGGSFNPVALPTGFSSSFMITQCFYGNPNGNAYNAYCTVDTPGSTFRPFPGFLFSSDSGQTWSVMTTRVQPNAQLPAGMEVCSATSSP